MARERDTGLVRALGPWSLAASIVSMIVGAAIFAAPGRIAAALGAYAPLAFLACSVAVGAVAICLAEGGSRVPTSGGLYGYIDLALGPLAGYVAGTLLWVGDVLACGGVAAALADVAASVAPAPLATVLRAAVVIGVVGTVALINVGGVRLGARLVSITTAVKLLPLAVFVVVGAGAMHAANFSAPTSWHVADAGRAMLLATFALMGMEGSLCASGEVAAPSRTIPRALALAIAAVALLYVAIQCVAQGLIGPALAASPVPLADAIAQVHPALRGLMLAGAALSMLGWIGSDVLSSPRMLFALGRDGLLPRVLGRIHGRTHAPYVAILCYAAIAVLLALTGTFAELAVLSTLTSAALYIGGCLAAWLLVRRGIASAGEPLQFRWLGAAAVIGIASMLVLIALASRAEIFGLFALIAVSVIIHLMQTRALLARGAA